MGRMAAMRAPRRLDALVKGISMHGRVCMLPLLGIVVGLIAVALVSYLIYAYPLRSEVIPYLQPSRSIGYPLQSSICRVGAFLSSALIFGSIMRGHDVMRVATIPVGFVSVALGCMTVPFLAAFPPLTALLCRLYCPDDLCYPRESGYRFRPWVVGDHVQMLAACIAMDVMAFSMMSGLDRLSFHRDLDAVIRVMVVIMCVVVGVCGYRMIRRRGRVQPWTMVLSSAYHLVEIWFWICFCAGLLIWARVV